MNTESRLGGRRALVTGGGRGIGAATAARLAADGADVAVLDLTAEACAETVERIERAGARAFALAADVSDAGAVEAAVAAAEERLGGIDLLVSNAGNQIQAPIVEMSEEAWDSVVEVNLRGAFLVTRAVARRMIAARFGKIVIVSSRAADGREGTGNYAAAKAGQIALARTLAYELGPANVNVNVVAPGFIESAFSEQVARDKGVDFATFRRQFEETLPLRRVGQPEDVANVIAFLLSEDASYVTGQVIVASGAP